ncbi:MAG: carboxypeptidase-like regulatory domain-containing protein [bacterium]|nr:carboxypeptidase-like regulatory domain-containing protein [bacterium]
MLGSRLTTTLAAIALLTPLATSQLPAKNDPTTRAAGQVLSFDGRPADFATVTVFDTEGRRTTEFVTTELGRFDYRSKGAIGHLQVQDEGVRVKVEFTGSTDPERLRVSFEDVPHFTMRGRILDPGGLPMHATDVLLRGEFDETLVNVTTDANGRYVARIDRGIWSLVVDPMGLAWAEPREVGGSGTIDIDLRNVGGDFFSIAGRALDKNGSPITNAWIHAASQQHVRLERPARKDGSFLLWSRRPIDYLLVLRDGDPIALRYGRIDHDTSLEVDARRHGFVTVTGRVLDGQGQGVPYANLLPADEGGRPLTRLRMLARCDPDGNFRARVPRTIPNLYAWVQPEGTAVAAWRIDESVELVLR